MSESTPTQAPAVTWRTRAVRRVAGSVGAAVVIAGVAPALANAAGAGVPNPVVIALRASGRGISSAFSGSSTDGTVAACEPTASPVVTVSADPDDAVESAAPSASASAEATETVTATAVASESVTAEPVATTAAPTAEPSESASEDADEGEGEDCEESASPTVAPTSEAPEESEAPDEDGTHGQIVSTVAKCAPHGKDPLLSVEGAPTNHGGYVRPAAHGESLTTPWGTFDLSTQAGADALCASLDGARAALPEAEKAAKEHGKKDHAKKEKSPKGGKGKKNARP
jgi:hypothetical protein